MVAFAREILLIWIIFFSSDTKCWSINELKPCQMAITPREEEYEGPNLNNEGKMGESCSTSNRVGK